MRNILKKTLGRGSEDQKGFTLIELLVVVGIIVALAAVIVPMVIQFSGRGDAGAPPPSGTPSSPRLTP